MHLRCKRSRDFRPATPCPSARFCIASSSVFFLTGNRVSAVIGAGVGCLETDGVEHLLHVTRKRNKKRRKILVDAARLVLGYPPRAGIQHDKEGSPFRPMTPDANRLTRRPLYRKTLWRPFKNQCRAAGIDPSRLALAASASVRCARRRSTTPSATGPPCTRLLNLRATPISERPRLLRPQGGRRLSRGRAFRSGHGRRGDRRQAGFPRRTCRWRRGAGHDKRDGRGEKNLAPARFVGFSASSHVIRDLNSSSETDLRRRARDDRADWRSMLRGSSGPVQSRSFALARHRSYWSRTPAPHPVIRSPAQRRRRTHTW